MTRDSAQFYRNLPLLAGFSDVTDLANYVPAPDDWSLVISDVQGSTKAIEAGRYKDVNTLGVGTIVAVSNALNGEDIPYVFGGDGATLLVPTARVESIKPALRGLRSTAADVFDLGLRVGIVPVAELNARNEPILIARYPLSEHVHLAMFAGNGMTVAEKMVKDPVNGHLYAVDDEGPKAASFDGFECRWRPIQSQNGHVVSLMVQERSSSGDAYLRIVERLNTILGGGDGRPVAAGSMELSDDPETFNAEAGLKAGAPSGLRFRIERLKVGLLTALGRFLLRSKRDFGGFPGSVYLDQVIANSDFRKFDDTLRMVVDVSIDQRAQIRAMLQAEHDAGQVVFGMYSADAALMTCVIERHEGAHVHFVDGADGGYALAAKEMKAQIKALSV